MTRRLFAAMGALANAVFLALMSPAGFVRLTDEGTYR